jgi:uncharacterized iron-regulated membrane protein
MLAMFSKFKKRIRQIHLWLGLLSGLVVFIIAITGAIWTFETEISDLVYSYRKVEIQNNKSIISIAEIKDKVKPYLKKINNISYFGKDRSIEVREWNEINGKLINNYVYLNPYTGEVLKVKINELIFFDVVLDLHMNLLLGDIGAEIVSYSTLIFLIMLISGIYLWWPKNKSGVKQRLKFDWKNTTRWRRKNFDLHSILGFYTCWIIIFATITGLAWSFKWMDKTIYAIATLGEEYKDYSEINSESSIISPTKNNVDDSVLNQAIDLYNIPFESWYYYFPQNETESISLYINPDAKTWYNSSIYYFDQRTGKLLLTESSESFNNGQSIRNMYYDIHIGKILGLPGQILVFFASLIVASLPITGFIIWKGRKKINVNKDIQPSNT